MSFYLTNVNIIGGNKKSNSGNITKINENKNKDESNKKINTIETNLKNESKFEIKKINNENKKKIIPQINQTNKSDKNTKVNLINDVKKNYFTFFIDKNIKYADLNKVEQYYYNEIFKKSKIYNDNIYLIKKKKEEYNQYIGNIYNLLIKNYPILVDSIGLKESFIKNWREKIKLKENDLIVYNHMKKRLSDAKNGILKRIQSELLYDDILQNQYLQYQIIKKHAFFQLKADQNKLNHIKIIYEKNVEEQNQKIYEKMQEKNNLDDDIDILKLGTHKYEEYLRDIKIEKKRLKRNYLYKKECYLKILNEYKTIHKEYYQNKLQLEKTFHSLKLKNIDKIILYYNNIYDSLKQFHQTFYFLNRDIQDLNVEYSQLDKELIDIKKKFIGKQKFIEQKLEGKNTKKIKTLTLLNKCEEKELNDIITEKIIILNKIINFIIGELKNSIRKLPRTKCVISNDIQELILNEQQLQVHLDLDDNELKNILIKIIHLFFQLSNVIMFIALSSVSKGINNNTISQFPIDTINEKEKSSEINKKSINYISNIFKDLNQIELKEENRMKEKKIKRNKSSIHLLAKKLKFPKEGITEKEIFSNFIQFYINKEKMQSRENKIQNPEFDLEKDLEIKRNSIEQNYMKLNSFLSKYENSLVEKNSKYNYNISKIFGNKNLKLSSFTTKNNINQTKLRKYSNSPPSLDDSEMEIDIEEPENLIEKPIIKKKELNTNLLNVVINKDKKNIFYRIDDLRNLNASFFQTMKGGKIKTVTNLTFDIELQAKLHEYLKKEKKERKEKKKETFHKHKIHSPTVRLDRTYNKDFFIGRNKRFIKSGSMRVYNSNKYLNFETNTLKSKNKTITNNFFNGPFTPFNNNINKKIQFNSLTNRFNKERNFSFSTKDRKKIKNENNSKNSFSFRNGIFFINKKSNSSEKINKPLII